MALAAVILLLGYLCLAPFVIYVEPDLPSLLSSRITRPVSFFSCIVGKEGGILSRFRTPSLVVTTMLEGGKEYSSPRLIWGKSGGEGDYSLPYDKYEMYSYFLKENENKTIGILYDSDDSDESRMALSLLEAYPSAVGVPYGGRVSVVNEDEVISSLDSLWGVLVLDPEKTSEAWSKTKAKVIMDSLSAASSVSLERVVSIGYDWKRILSLFFREGRVEVHYAFTVLENPEKV